MREKRSLEGTCCWIERAIAICGVPPHLLSGTHGALLVRWKEQMVGGRAHGHRSIDQVGPTNGGQHRRRVELGIEDHRAEAVSVDVSDESSPAPQPRVVEISEMGRVTDDRSPGCHCEAWVLNEDQPAARAEESDDLFAGGPVKLGRR